MSSPPNRSVRPPSARPGQTIPRGIRVSSRCHRLRTLPLPVAHQADGVRGKRCALGCRPHNSADPVEVGGQSALSIEIKQVFHPYDVADFSADWQLIQSVVLSVIFFVNQEMPRSPIGAVHIQLPNWHVSPPEQTCPHFPQLLLSNS
jgi:hypothetical protein